MSNIFLNFFKHALNCIKVLLILIVKKDSGSLLIVSKLTLLETTL